MNLFGIIRQDHARCWDEIKKDSACWEATHIAPQSYYRASHMYQVSEDADFGTMCAGLYERSQATPETIKLYHEWIALYMYGEGLTDEELKYRQQLAKRMNDHE